MFQKIGLHKKTTAMYVKYNKSKKSCLMYIKYISNTSKKFDKSSNEYDEVLDYIGVLMCNHEVDVIQFQS